MQFFVESWTETGQVLGNLDGQRSWRGIGYRQTAWYRQLKTGQTLARAEISEWRIVDQNGNLVERIQRKLTGLQQAPGMFQHHDCARCKNGKMSCVAGNPRSCQFPQAKNE